MAMHPDTDKALSIVKARIKNRKRTVFVCEIWDTFLICSALAVACWENIWTSAYLGSIAAACQVEGILVISLSQFPI